jgi:hypothetical protein
MQTGGAGIVQSVWALDYGRNDRMTVVRIPTEARFLLLHNIQTDSTSLQLHKHSGIGPCN